MKLDEKFVFTVGEQRFGNQGIHLPKLAVSMVDGERMYVDLAPVLGAAIQGITVDGVPVSHDAMYAKLQEFRSEPSTIVITLSGWVTEVTQSYQGA